MPKESLNRYSKLIEHIFQQKYHAGDRSLSFTREDINSAAHELSVRLPSNLGDVLYSFRFRTSLPESIEQTAPDGEQWVIELAGRGRYYFHLKPIGQIEIAPNILIAETKIPDSTPGIVTRYALSDEQALLAKLRYNRLIDIFTGITCYSLQNHLRTTVPNFGQVETDEIYIGIDRRGIHYAIPIQAKGGRDKLGIVQIEQDVALCLSKYPSLVCRPIGAQFISTDLIALFEFEPGENGIALISERHYRLVPSGELTEKELLEYRLRLTQ